VSTLEQHTNSVIDHAGLKVVTVWAMVGITSWADVAAFLAAVYSALLILEWLWKKFLRTFCEQRGWLRLKNRRRDDSR
jgi:uncharacterized protein HemY